MTQRERRREVWQYLCQAKERLGWHHRVRFHVDDHSFSVLLRDPNEVGVAWPCIAWILLRESVWDKLTPRFRRELVNHELCHVVGPDWTHRYGHGPKWRAAMRRLGHRNPRMHGSKTLNRQMRRALANPTRYT
jgi:hypothetical protein